MICQDPCVEKKGKKGAFQNKGTVCQKIGEGRREGGGERERERASERASERVRE